MSESICVTLKKFAHWYGESPEGTSRQCAIPMKLELKLSFDGEQHFIEEAWLDETIDFYAIADKYNFLDKLLEEALTQLKKDKELASLQDKITALEFETSLY